jgi:uncharacterized LabA/DUF88 family protein
LKRVALFIDFENLRKSIFDEANSRGFKKINHNNPKCFLPFLKSFINADEEIYRIFIYLSEPLKEVNYRGKDYDFSENAAYQMHVKFIENMQVQDNVALRKGKMKFRGFKDPECKHIDVVQKQVDMLIGLDIAHVAYNKLVDRIMIFCSDTDIIPALKTARINGLQVILTCCSDVQTVNNGIKAHSDYIRDIKYQDIISNIIKP